MTTHIDLVDGVVGDVLAAEGGAERVAHLAGAARARLRLRQHLEEEEGETGKEDEEDVAYSSLIGGMKST